MTSQNKLRDELIEHLEQGIARASEAQDAIKFSESLVRREIHLTRLQLDIQLNKLETRTQFELRQTVERETKTVQHIIEQLSNIIKRVKSQDIPEAELEMVASDIEELLGFIKRKKIKFHESSDINTIFEGQENFGSFSITTISPGPRVTVPCNQLSIRSNDEIQCKQTTNVVANRSEEKSPRGTHRSSLRPSQESHENETVDDERDRREPLNDHQQFERNMTGSGVDMSLSDSDADPDSSSSPIHEDCILNDLASQSSPPVDNEEVTDQFTDLNVRVGDASESPSAVRQTGEGCFIKNTTHNITTDTDDDAPNNRHGRGRSLSFGSSHHEFTDGSLTSSRGEFENGSINRTVLKPSPRRSLRSDSSKDANRHKNDDNSVNTDIRHFRRTCEVSDSEQDNNSNVSHDVIHLRRQNDMNENKWAFGRQSRINNRDTRLNSIDSNEYEDNTSRFDSDEFDDYYDQDDTELDQDYDNAYISRSERVEKANREWFGDRTRGDSRSLTRQRSRSASPRSARIRSHGKASHTDRDDNRQPSDITNSSVKVSTSCVENHQQHDGLISNIEHLMSDHESREYRIELESEMGRSHVDNENDMTRDSDLKGRPVELNKAFDTTLEPNEKLPREREMFSHQTIYQPEGFKTDVQDDNDTDVDHYNKACKLFTDDSLLASSSNLDNCEDENNKVNDGDANLENTLLATHDELFGFGDDASEPSYASSPNSISSCCVALNEDAVVDHGVKPAKISPAEQPTTSESDHAQKRTNLKLKRMRNRSINDNIDSLFQSRGLDNAQCTPDVDANRDQQCTGNVDVALDAKNNGDEGAPFNDSSRMMSVAECANADTTIEPDGDEMQELAQSDFVSHYCTIRRKRKGGTGKPNMSQVFQQSAGKFATSDSDRNLEFEKTFKTNGPEMEGSRNKTVHHNKNKLPSFNEMLYS